MRDASRNARSVDHNEYNCIDLGVSTIIDLMRAERTEFLSPQSIHASFLKWILKVASREILRLK